MIIEKIIIANLKCEGCANTIIRNLGKMAGVSHIMVDHINDMVIIEHKNKTNREAFLKKLSSLGYPEATEENGLLTQLKSYASCLIGKINK